MTLLASLSPESNAPVTVPHCCQSDQKNRIPYRAVVNHRAKQGAGRAEDILQRAENRRRDTGNARQRIQCEDSRIGHDDRDRDALDQRAEDRREQELTKLRGVIAEITAENLDLKKTLSD